MNRRVAVTNEAKCREASIDLKTSATKETIETDLALGGDIHWAEENEEWKTRSKHTKQNPKPKPTKQRPNLPKKTPKY